MCATAFADRPAGGPPLQSWKEIATYLGRTVRTVQRWEREQNLPVHRHVHNTLATVYAYPHELDAWWQSRKASLDKSEPARDEDAKQPPRDSGAGEAGGQQGQRETAGDAETSPIPTTPADESPPQATTVAAGESEGRRPLGRVAMFFAAGRTSVWRRGLWLVGFAALIVAAAAWRTTAGHQVAGRRFKAIAVLPLRDVSMISGHEYLADGLTESLVNRLSMTAGLRVISLASTARYKHSGKPTRVIGQELGVDAIVEGSVQQSANRIGIRLRLVDVATEQDVWTGSYERSTRELLRTEDEMAQAVRREIGPVAGADTPSSTTTATAVDPEAYELYLQGRQHWKNRTLDDLRKALVYFSDAIDKDVTFAPAYAGLADTYLLLPAYSGAKPADIVGPARRAATRAIAIDDRLAEAHASLAYLKQVYEWDFTGAEREFRRAIALNPNYAVAHHWYAIFLKSVGRRQEAIAEMKRALAIDPLSLIIATDLGVVYMIDRQYDRATEQFTKTLEVEPDFGEARHQLAWTCVFEGRYQAALEELDRWNLYAGQPAEYFAATGYVYGRMHRQHDADAARDDLLRLYQRGEALSYHLAVLYTGLGDNRRAFEWLEKAYNDRILVDLPYHPMWDPLRAAPGFAALEQRNAFPPHERQYLLSFAR